MWELSISPLELVARATLVYLLFLGALRVFGRRELGQFKIFTLNRGVAIARRRVPLVRRLLEYEAAEIGRDGRWISQAIDREELDQEDLDQALREHGLDSVSDVKLAVLEQDGSISIVPAEGPSVRMRARRRRYKSRR